MNRIAVAAIGSGALIPWLMNASMRPTGDLESVQQVAQTAACTVAGDDDRDCAPNDDVQVPGRIAIRAALTAFDASTLELAANLVSTGAPAPATFTKTTAFRPARLGEYSPGDPCRRWAETYNRAIAAWPTIVASDGHFDAGANVLANVIDLVNSASASVGAQRCRARIHVVDPSKVIRAFMPVP